MMNTHSGLLYKTSEYRREEIANTFFPFLSSNASLYSPPLCTCGVHLSYSRARLRMINDNYRNIIFDKALEQVR